MLSNQSGDEELWIAVSNNDVIAFRILFNRYWQKIYITAYRYLKNKQACQELTQELFITLWNKRHYLNIVNFGNYINASTRYGIYKILKDAQKFPVVYLEPEVMNSDFFYNDGALKLQYADLIQQVNIYLEKLPKRCKEIFILSRIENLSNDEIAEKLQVSKRTVENQLTYALKHLRIALKNYLRVITLFM